MDCHIPKKYEHRHQENIGKADEITSKLKIRIIEKVKRTFKKRKHQINIKLGSE